MPNHALVWGTVDSDINVKQVGDDKKKVADLRVNDGSTWITIVGWEAVAEKMAGLSKGMQIIVGGRIRTRSYTPQGSDKKVYVTEVVASSVDVLSGAAPAADDDLIPD